MVELQNGEVRMSLGEIRKGEIFRTLDPHAGMSPWLIARGNAVSAPHPRRPKRKVWSVPLTLAPLH